MSKANTTSEYEPCDACCITTPQPDEKKITRRESQSQQTK